MSRTLTFEIEDEIYEALEQGVRRQWLALELGMKLNAQVPRVIRELGYLDEILDSLGSA